MKAHSTQQLVKIMLSFFVLFALQSCSNQEEVSPETTGNTLQIDLKNPAEQAVLISFYGDRQTIIDYPEIVDNKMVYPLVEDLPFGIYRLQIDDYLIDFVHNGEDVHLSLDRNQGGNGVEVITSKENAHYLGFLKEYQQAFQDSITCDAYHSLSKKYVTKSGLLSEQFIAFLLNTTFNCGNDEWEDYLNQIQLSDELLLTPYFQLQLESVVEELSQRDGTYPSLYHKMMANASGNTGHFITKAFWNVALSAQDIRYLEQIAKGEDATISCVNDNISLEERFSLGMKIENDLTELKKTSGIQQHVIFVEGNACGFTEAEKNRLMESTQDDSSIAYYRLNTSSLTREIIEKYNLFITPMILITDADGTLVSSFIGYQDGLKALNEN